jgi:excisionase family DNA binding protein
MRKSDRTRPYAPDFVGAATLAYRLDCSETTIHEYVRAGVLPAPSMIGNLVRWRWSEVEAHLAQQDGATSDTDGQADEYTSDIVKFAAARKATDGSAS